MRDMTRILMMALLACVLSACRPPTVPPYEDLRGQELRAVIYAWQAGDLELASDKLNRLPDLKADPLTCDWVQRDLADERFLRQLVELQAEDQLTEASQAVRQRMHDVGLGPRLERAEHMLANLQRLRAYLDQLPFDEASRGQRALAELPPATAMPSPRYAAWLGQQQQALADQARAEERHLQQEVWQSLAQALPRGGSEARLALARWLMVSPEAPGARLWRGMAAAAPGGVLPLMQAERDPLARELGWFFIATQGTAREQDALPDLLRGQWPASYPGIYAACFMELRLGRLATGLARFNALRQRLPSLDLGPLQSALRQAFAAPPASPATLPSVPGVLEAILTLEAQP
jgi:hypothetical protein